MRKAASCCQPRQESVVPVWGRTIGIGLFPPSRQRGRRGGSGPVGSFYITFIRRRRVAISPCRKGGPVINLLPCRGSPMLGARNARAASAPPRGAPAADVSRNTESMGRCARLDGGGGADGESG